MKYIMEKIFRFEDGPETVESFNEIFSHNPLTGFDNNETVSIGEPCSPETCRTLKIGAVEFRYDFSVTPLEVVESCAN